MKISGQQKRVAAYLLGRSWFSANEGEGPNCREFPKRLVINESEARSWLAAESRNDTHWNRGSWDCGSDKAYIAPVYADGTIGDRIYAN